MRAGLLNSVLTIYKYEPEIDEFGQEEIQYTKGTTTKGQFKFSASDKDAIDSRISELNYADLTIRNYHDVTVNDLIYFKGFWKILSIYEEDRMLKLRLLKSDEDYILVG
jgi:hypothetical protein